MSKRNQSIWIPFADAMTGLMLIFLLIVVLVYATNHEVLSESNEIEKLKSKLAAKTQEVLSANVKSDELEVELAAKTQKILWTSDKLEEFESILVGLYEELESAFADKREEWGIQVLHDLTIKFKNPDILFDRDSATIKPKFKDILDEFTPKYLSIIGKEKYAGKIKEIKIEGHTARVSPRHNTYIKTVGLSQNRARSILSYILQIEYFRSLTQEEQNKIIFLLSANGFGNGRALDATGKYVYNTNNRPSRISRRVEFKIVTNDSYLINQLINVSK